MAKRYRAGEIPPWLTTPGRNPIPPYRAPRTRNLRAPSRSAGSLAEDYGMGKRAYEKRTRRAQTRPLPGWLLRATAKRDYERTRTQPLPITVLPAEERARRPGQAARRLSTPNFPAGRRRPTRPLPILGRGWWSAQPTIVNNPAPTRAPYRRKSFWDSLFARDRSGITGGGSGHLNTIPERIAAREQRAAKVRRVRAFGAYNRAKPTAILGLDAFDAYQRKRHEPIGTRTYIPNPVERYAERPTLAPNRTRLLEWPAFPPAPTASRTPLADRERARADAQPVTQPRASLSQRARSALAGQASHTSPEHSFLWQQGVGQNRAAAARLRNAAAFRPRGEGLGGVLGAPAPAPGPGALPINRSEGLDLKQLARLVGLSARAPDATQILRPDEYPTYVPLPASIIPAAHKLTRRSQQLWQAMTGPIGPFNPPSIPLPTLPQFPNVSNQPTAILSPLAPPLPAPAHPAQRLNPGMVPPFNTLGGGPLTVGGTRNPFFPFGAPPAAQPGAAPAPQPAAEAAAGAAAGGKRPAAKAAPKAAPAAKNSPYAQGRATQRANDIARALGAVYLPQANLRSPVDAVVDWLATAGTPGGLLLPLAGLMLFTSAVAPVGPRGETRFALMYRALWGRVEVPYTQADIAGAIINAEHVPVLQREIAGVLGGGIATGLINAGAALGGDATVATVAGAAGAAVGGVLQPWLDPLEQLWQTSTGGSAP